MFRNTSLTLRQLLILLTGLGLLPIALIGAWGINTSVNEQQAELERSMQALSRALASAVDSELDATLENARALSVDPALARGDIATFYAVAKRGVQAQADWRSVILTDAGGAVLFKTSEPFGGNTHKVIDRASLDEAARTLRPVVGSVAKGPRGLAAVPIRVPVVDDGRLRYIVTIALAPDRMLRILNNQKVPPEWVVAVADARGLRVARSKDQENTVATPTSATLGQLLAQGRPEGSGVSTTSEGVEVMTSFSMLPRHKWLVAIGAPTARFSDVLRRTLAAYAVAIVASLALYVVLAMFLSKRLMLSIEHVKEQTARLGHKHPVRLLRSRIREINEIGDSLAAASAELVQGEREREALVVSLQEALARAEQAAATKDNFLAVLGHELRNPLAPIVMALDLMDMRGAGEHLRERETMRRQVNHMRRLVDDLLDVSRITQGKLAMACEPVCLSAAVLQAADTVRPAMAAARRRFIESVDDVWVMGDETRLVQVATNLLSNALRYGGAGDVSVSVRRIGASAVLSVSDLGVGMEPATAARIFQPFWQAPQPLARSSGGLGLGLTIVYSIVELLGGTVRASSPGLGQGSRFDVTLPAIDGPAVALPSAAPGADAGARKIMIVDDSLDAAQTTAELLEVLGHEVGVAHDGKSALALLGRMQPDVAILDIGLPDMDGFELGRAVRRLGFDGTLLALTGYGQERDKQRAKDAGFDRHLTKPVDIEQLQLAIDAGLDLTRGDRL
ncbi:response regulator [Massilia sp. R2A-15]|uniref:hybrid sensor histidine kinase/response regulator n=1 Tax=Massilia sp. R2A-15 TaxID=3064278 RepID=UPI0027337A1C|nr:ATP-binding protein [Massilia sp. R2A-15]WLI90825.1 response regulator [Massilia sp. R2A-15]